MAITPTIFGRYPLGTKPLGYFSSSSPIVPNADYLTPILQAMEARLVTESVFTATQVGISFSELPSSQLIADFACNLLPADGTYDEGQVTGIGRYGSGYTDLIHVNVYGRNSLDVIYLDTSLLTDSALGLLLKTQAVFNALQLFLPIGSYGNLLTEEPIRLLYVTEPTKYKHSPEWSYISLVFEVKSCFNIANTI
jgi:hypothetical protein